MSIKILCQNSTARVAVVGHFIASHASIRSCEQKLSSPIRYISSYSSQTALSRPLSLLLRCEVRQGPASIQSISARRRRYATDSDASISTIQGTIDEGASGVGREAQREKERLQAPDYLNEKEKMIFEKLDGALEPVKLEVQDISGGCGSMYGIEIVSERFRGLSMLKQQRLVNEVLGEEIKGWHGVQLKTRVP